MVQVSCSVGRISRLDSRLAYQSSPLNGRTTSFLRSINTVFMEIVRVSVLRLFDRSIDPKVSKKKSTKIQSPSYSQNQIQTIPSSEPIPSIRDILFWERRYAKYRIRVLETRSKGTKIVGDGNETNEIPFLPRWRGVLLPPPPLFLVNRNQNGARDLWESG